MRVLLHGWGRCALRALACLVALAALQAAWVPALPAQGFNGAVVLMYHRFGEDQYPSTSIRLAQFEAHLEALQQGPYTVVPLADVVAAYREDRPLPDRAVAITIDDAYRTVYTEGWPRLREAGFPFTVFVATQPLDRGFGDMMTWAQLREMVQTDAVTVGNHTVSHLHMPDHAPERLRQELQESQGRIAAETGVTPDVFAYPYGEFGAVAERIVGEEGFVAAFGQHSGVIGSTDGPFRLPRFALNEHYGDMDRFNLVIDTLPLPAQDVTPADWVLGPEAANPPHFGFTVPEAVGDLSGLSCFVSGQGRLELSRPEPRRVEGQVPQALPEGRSRINCTLRHESGRYRWYGVQFYVPEAP